VCSGVETRENAFLYLIALVALLEDLYFLLQFLRAAPGSVYVNKWQDLVYSTVALQWNRKMQCGNFGRRMLTLFELFGSVFLFIWCGNAVPNILLPFLKFFKTAQHTWPWHKATTIKIFSW